MNNANAQKLADDLVRSMYGGFDLATLEELAEIGAKAEAESPLPEVKMMNAAIHREIERLKTEAQL